MVTKEELKKYQIAYSTGNPLIDDATYDDLLEEYLQQNGENNRPFLRQKQSAAVNDIVGTLPKVYGVREPFRPGQKTYKEWLKDESFNILLQPKFNGCSIAMDVKTNKFFTRGNYDDGESIDVTELFIDRIQESSTCDSMKFEGIMCYENFKALGLDKKYVDPLAAVSAIITSRNVELAKYIDLICLREYHSDGNQYFGWPVQYLGEELKSYEYDKIEIFIDELLSNGAMVEYDVQSHDDNKHYSVDGVVVSACDLHHMGYVEGSISIDELVVDQNKEVAIKILNNIKETILRDIKYQLGKSGRITPVATVDPVMFGKKSITSPTLSTLERVVSNNFKYGDVVRIVHNIVPYLIDSLGGGTQPIPIPTKCPICNSPLDLSTLKLVKCKNLDCPGLKFGTVVRYCQKMRMFGISEGIISKLMDAGLVTDIASLYDLTVKDVSNVDGLGERSAQNIIDAIKERSKNVELHQWLGAFPMNDVGSRTWRSIIKYMFHDDIDRVLSYFDKPISILGLGEQINEQYIYNVPGIGKIIAEKISIGMDINSEVMCNVRKHLTFAKPKPMGNKLSLGSVCLTGTRDEGITKYLTDKGYTVDSYNKNTIAVIIPEPSYVSNKVKDAREKYIQVLTIEEAYKYL